MIKAITSALSGMDYASRRINTAAENIANASTAQGADEINLPEQAVELKLSENSYKANLATLKTIDDMQDELLNLFDEKV